MQIICISRGSFACGKALAEKLAANLGSECVSRESLTDLATASGIPVGKIEMAVLNKRPLSEELTVAIDRFKAFLSITLCEKALKNGIVYHGRTGHLVLPGVSPVMRLRVIADPEERIKLTMQRLHLAREKAKRYIEQVDDDRRRWVRILYNVDWEAPSLYDLTVNVTRLSVDNSAAALVQMAELPDFQTTPASRQALADLLLASRCRLAIGQDERTSQVAVNVRAERGNVSITYPPRQAEQARAITEVVAKVPGVESFVCTVATTTILYVQERFDPNTDAFRHLLEVAGKWNAAIDLVRLVPTPDDSGDCGARPAPTGDGRDGGILDDTPDASDFDTEGHGVPETLHHLVNAGRAGGYRTVYGGIPGLLASVDRNERYSLVTLGDVFLDRPAATRARLKRDLAGQLVEKLRIPVIDAEEIKERYLFGPRQWLNLIFFSVLTAAIYLLVFSYQAPILEMLTAKGTLNRLAATASVVLSIPVAAFIIGNVAHNLLKLIKLE
jgi:cytidylate kinase